MASPTFELGQVVATPAALEMLSRCGCSPAQLLARHANGDWGDLPPVDASRNQQALQEGSRILSSYRLEGDAVWIITEAEDGEGRRPATTLLLPEEY